MQSRISNPDRSAPPSPRQETMSVESFCVSITGSQAFILKVLIGASKLIPRAGIVSYGIFQRFHAGTAEVAVDRGGLRREDQALLSYTAVKTTICSQSLHPVTRVCTIIDQHTNPVAGIVEPMERTPKLNEEWAETTKTMRTKNGL
ncbi:hypothetical protein [Absidia glauca]|uniref:Uncharacterized protein n=1 Tax=Absidia glauca TaxID=4829 RepID=A0A168MGN2_ABSGL|nr:hypothetical protein [Absidia glauca]